MADICNKEGFYIKNYSNKVISASYGEGDRIDIASHLDVVGQGEGWKYDPFLGEIIGDSIYGRGSQDMKAGAFLTFLALKIIKDNNIKLNKKINLVYGCDEERTMNDLRYYIKKEGYPSFAFSPDGSFPMAIGEKGALMWVMEGKYKGIVESFDCGIQPNVVSPVAKAVINDTNIYRIKKYLSDNNIKSETEIKDNKIFIKIYGKSAHASTPLEGEDATLILFKLIKDLYKDKIIGDLYNIFADPYGNNAGIYNNIYPMGKLTFICGKSYLKNNKIVLYSDCRYPYGISSKELTEKLKNNISNFSIDLRYDDEPTLLENNNKYVKILMDVYKKVTNDDTKYFISEGVSYSKVYKNCVTFGALGNKSLKTAHKADENIKIKDCISALEIYYYAILALSAS